MKKILALTLATLLFVAACASPAAPPAVAPPAAPPAPAEAPATPTPAPVVEAPPGEVSNFDLGLLGVSLFSLEIPFPVATYEGVTRAAANLGANVTVIDAMNDVAKNVSDVEDLKAAGMAVLIIMPVDSYAVAPVVLDVMAEGIPVIAVNRWVGGVDVDVWIGTDNVQAGAAKGERFMELVDEGTRIIILEGTPGAGSGIDRLAGFMSVVEGRVEVLASQTANFNRVDGMHVSENLLVAHPDAEVIVAMNDEMALGAIEAAFALGLTPGEDILITGFDGMGGAREAVADGYMLFTVFQDPDGMGYLAVEVALGILRGETFPAIMPFDIGFVER